MADEKKIPQTTPIPERQERHEPLGDSSDSIERLRKAMEIPPRTGGDSSNDFGNDD